MAFMGSAQFQKDKFGILLDAVYAKLSTDGTWVQNRVDTETETKLGFYTAALSYRVYDDPKGFVDVYGGARYFDTSVEFKLGTTLLGEASFSKSLNWTDCDHRRARRRERSTTAGRCAASPTTAASTAPTTRAGRSTAAPTMPSATAGKATLGYRYVSIQKKVTDRRQPRHRHPGPALRHHLQVLSRA